MPMLESVEPIVVGKDHTIVIPRRPAEEWIRAGPAFMAPLRYKRHLSVDEADWVHAWTVYDQAVDTSDWVISPSSAPGLMFDIKAHSHPSGWRFTIPQKIRHSGWLPETGGWVI